MKMHSSACFVRAQQFHLQKILLHSETKAPGGQLGVTFSVGEI